MNEERETTDLEVTERNFKLSIDDLLQAFNEQIIIDVLPAEIHDVRLINEHNILLKKGTSNDASKI